MNRNIIIWLLEYWVIYTYAPDRFHDCYKLHCISSELYWYVIRNNCNL